MVLWFSLLYTIVVAQRIWELQLAKRNGRRMRELGGYEVGAEHYKYLVLLHISFFFTLPVEFALRGSAYSPWMTVPVAVFLLLQAARLWCIRSLGVHWNTRIIVVPGMKLVRKGPYRFMRHPNYVVVTLELLIFPLIFGCYWSAALFPVVNMLILRKRIAEEEQALYLAREAGGVNGT